MYLKQITYALKSKLSVNHNITLKNAHIHELLASWNGFKSKASMDTSGIFGLNEFNFSEENEELELFYSRGATFGYSTQELTTLNNEILIILDELNLTFIPYEELTLEKPSHKDGYWYRKRLEGVKLSTSQTQFANEYELQLSTFEQNIGHLTSAANRDSIEAAMTLATFYNEFEEYEDDEDTDDKAYNWYLVAAKLGSVNAKSELALHYGMNEYREEATEYGMNEYREEAAEYGKKECIEKMARLEKSPEKIHYWNELAILYGHDITTNEAINDGGNWFVGYEGIDLPMISEKEKKEAELKAAATFDKYSEDYEH